MVIGVVVYLYFVGSVDGFVRKNVVGQKVMVVLQFELLMVVWCVMLLNEFFCWIVLLFRLYCLCLIWVLIGSVMLEWKWKCQFVLVCLLVFMLVNSEFIVRFSVLVILFGVLFGCGFSGVLDVLMFRQLVRVVLDKLVFQLGQILCGLQQDGLMFGDWVKLKLLSGGMVIWLLCLQLGKMYRQCCLDLLQLLMVFWLQKLLLFQWYMLLCVLFNVFYSIELELFSVIRKVGGVCIWMFSGVCVSVFWVWVVIRLQMIQFFLSVSVVLFVVMKWNLCEVMVCVFRV